MRTDPVNKERGSTEIRATTRRLPTSRFATSRCTYKILRSLCQRRSLIFGYQFTFAQAICHFPTPYVALYTLIYTLYTSCTTKVQSLEGCLSAVSFSVADFKRLCWSSCSHQIPDIESKIPFWQFNLLYTELYHVDHGCVQNAFYNLRKPISQARSENMPLSTTCLSQPHNTLQSADSLPRLPPAYPDPVDKERDSPIAFNNTVGKALDVELAHLFYHEKIIWCVKFSHDGKYLAAGCYDGKAYI